MASTWTFGGRIVVEPHQGRAGDTAVDRCFAYDVTFFSPPVVHGV